MAGEMGEPAAAAPLDIEHILQDFKPEELIVDETACAVLRKVLADKEADVSKILSILHSLEHCVPLLGHDHKSLIKTILNLNWLDGGPELIRVFKAFVLSLLSAHTNYFKPFLVILVKKMREEYPVPPEASEEDKLKVHLKMEHDSQHLHLLLQSLCRLIPMATLVLLTILEEVFPYLNRSAQVFENYTRNLLKITTYVPSLRKDILDLIVKNMLKLDVRISREALSKANAEVEDEEEEEEFVEEEENEDIFSMEMDSTDKAGKGKKTEHVSLSGKDSHLLELLPLAVSLDAMMIIVLNFIKDTCYPGGTFDWAETKKLYRELLSSFDKFTFLTHLSNHTQFLLFYVCSFREALADGFVDYLWKKVTDPMSQPIYRQIAACYISSFLARAAYLPISTAQMVMKLMMNWVHAYLDHACDSSNMLRADMTHHAAFYSVCQACFYIFCFQHTQFTQMRKGYKWLEALNFQRVVTSKLNPLKFCLPIIVKTFSSATRTHQLAFCDTIVEHNKRYSLPVCSQNALDSMQKVQFHSFFPFDPYLLKKSSSFITPLYKEYQGVLPEEEALEDEDEDDFLPDEEADKDIHHFKSHLHDQPLGMSVDDKPSSSSIDLLQYGSSPGFQHGILDM